MKAENKSEYYLRNINQKLKSRNRYAWKIWMGLLLYIALAAVGALFITIGKAVPEKNFMVVAGIFFAAAILSLIINIAIGIIALYKSTKDYDTK
ncbi:MAG: hypothetical protein FWF34_02870 [Alphaproteobacteria bacterium]|nr:hypothetical protein [Alphaproteobacteria bacterium]MCL2890173.1 hypothetical protein [Alphaproteobacteria bacterium]